MLLTERQPQCTAGLAPRSTEEVGGLCCAALTRKYHGLVACVAFGGAFRLCAA